MSALIVSALDSRGPKAVELAAGALLGTSAWQVVLDERGLSYRVPSTVRGRAYRTTTSECSCPDATFRPHLICKHRLAAELVAAYQKTEMEPAF